MVVVVMVVAMECGGCGYELHVICGDMGCGLWCWLWL